LTTLAERAPTASVSIDLPSYPQVTGELFLERRSVPR
jgi:hypothetical protein